MNQVNDFDLLISKFKGKSGLITATTIREKGIARNENAQYRRSLLASAVIAGYAQHNGELPTHNKYGIYFNTEDRANPAVGRTFDPSVLNHSDVTNFPPRRLKTSSNIEYWNRHKALWVDIYALLCGFQLNEKINLELLPAYYHPDLKQVVSMKARELIFTYKMLKIGWDEIEKHLSSNGYNYNDLFQTILWANSTVFFQS
jgi:hypothetical protein